MVGLGVTSRKQPNSIEFRASHAVVIGINDYTNGIRRLDTPLNDATRLKTLLEQDHGYIVHDLLNERATLDCLTTCFTETLPSLLGPDDRLLVYFAGHGIAVNSDDGLRGFLFPQDADEKNQGSYLPMADLHKWLAELSCRHMLAILDCCFAGAFRWSSATRSSGRTRKGTLYQERFNHFMRSPAWQVLTSAAHNEEAMDEIRARPVDRRGVIVSEDGQRHSPFALALYDALAGKGDLIRDGVITATELSLYLQDRVRGEVLKAENREQTPGIWPLSKHDHRGEFFFLDPNYPLNLLTAEELTAGLNPWRGLNSYEQKDKPLYFGRTEAIEKLFAKVAVQAFTVVLGASGTGKSSLVKAGLLSRLAADTAEWEILDPIRPGAHPVNKLKQLLAQLLAAKLPDYAGQPLLERVAAAWAQKYPGRKLLLVVDQLEELVTLARDTERAEFLAVLAAAVAQQPDAFRLVVTLRTDFEPLLKTDHRLEPLWKDDVRYIVPPLTRAELQEIIEGPAAERVLYFEPPELVDTLIDEVDNTPGALPLLSFTLSEMFIRYVESDRDDRSLTKADYDDIGRIIGSLRKRANKEYGRLDTDHKATMARVMLRMISVEGGELARRRVSRSELIYPSDAENARVEKVLDRLVEARLLVIDRVKTGKVGNGDGQYSTVVEPAHDALVLAWDQLLLWKKAAEDYLPLQRQTAYAASLWAEKTPENRSGLLWDDDPRLQLLEETLWPTGVRRQGPTGRLRWVKQVLMPDTTPPVDTKWLNRTELDFVVDGVKERTSFWRRLGWISVAVMVALLALAGFAGSRAIEARRQALVTQGQSLAVLSGTVEDSNATDTDLNLLMALEALRLKEEVGGNFEWLVDRNLRQIIGRPDLKEIGYYQFRDSLIERVAYSPDGRHVTSGGNYLVLPWNLAYPECIPVGFSESDDLVYSVACSPDGRQRAWGLDDGTVRLWDRTDPAVEQVELRGHMGKVTAVVYAPDGRQLASAGDDGTVRLWDLTGPAAEAKVLRGHSGGVTAVAYAPDGRQLASGDGEGTVRLWDLTDPAAEPAVLRVLDGHVSSVAYSPDGRQLATGGRNPGSEGTVRLWDLDDSPPKSVVLRGHTGIVNTVAYSPDGRQLASGDDDGTVWLWDLAWPAAEPVVLTGHVRRVSSVAYSPDGRQLATGDDGGTVRLWNPVNPTATPVVLSGHSGGVTAVAYSPDGRQLASGADDGVVLLWPTTRALAALACSQVSRQWLTESEWNAYVGELLPWRSEGQCDLARGVPVWWPEE